MWTGDFMEAVETDEDFKSLLRTEFKRFGKSPEEAMVYHSALIRDAESLPPAQRRSYVRARIESYLDDMP